MKRTRENTASAERASICPFARFAVPRRSYRLAFALPLNSVLVNCNTYRVLQWGRDGHRELLRLGALSIAQEAAHASADGKQELELGGAAVDALGLRGEWEVSPHLWNMTGVQDVRAGRWTWW